MSINVRSFLLMLVVVGVLAAPDAAFGDFGFLPGSVSVKALNRDGTLDTIAGSHPDSFMLHFGLNGEAAGKSEGGTLRNLLIKLPPGLVGDPLAVPACSVHDLEAEACLSDTQIGVVRVVLGGGFGLAEGPLYNVIPPKGVTSEFGFYTTGFLSRQFISVRSEEEYGVGIDVLNVPLELLSVSATVWGVPADPEHDGERGTGAFEHLGGQHSDAALASYLTLPTSCAAAPKTTIEIDSVQEPSRYLAETVEAKDAGGNPAPMIGCETVPFNPKALLQPTSSSASTATGFGFELKLPDANLLNPSEGALVETQPRKAKIVLPAGMTVNPSVAVGIGVCSQTQYEAEQFETAPGAGCPAAAKIGDVVAHSPLIEEQVEGSIYLAQPYANPFKTLLAMYLLARSRERGVLVKQAGRIELDPSTGQITATFDHLPPLPYSAFEVRLREGSRAPLVTPSTCGAYESRAALTPFSAESDSEAKMVGSTFQIEHGVDGGPCPPGGVPPFQPGATAGSVNNAAGHYSPLYMRIERKDGEQEITGFSTLLPPGLSGNLSGVPFCPEADIQRAREQTGAEAEAAPACPAASRIGHSIAEAGVGNVLAQTPGELFLAGPFEGAPFSLVSITAATVGPFDLGTVVVRLPLNIDPITAQVSIPSGPADQIPHIIKGVVIHLRAIDVWVDRADFTLNPTSCNAMQIVDTIDGAGQNVASPADDTSASSTSRFQAADCANLNFKPIFKASTSSKTSRKNGASLKVTVAYPKAPLGTQANIRSVKVDLPKVLPSRLTTLQKACTAHQFEANPAGCPAASRVGTATAQTPILPVPLTGPAYFVSYGSAKFPELVVVLQGYGVTIQLHGETFINPHTNVTSSTFRTIPDQPVTNFQLSLPEGPDSALAAIGNLCTHKLVMPTAFTGQNGMTFKQQTTIAPTGCPKHKAKPKQHKKKKK